MLYLIISKNIKAIEIKECKSNRKYKCNSFKNFININKLIILKEINVKILDN